MPSAISSVRVHCLSSKPKSCFAQFILFLTAGGVRNVVYWIVCVVCFLVVINQFFEMLEKSEFG